MKSEPPFEQSVLEEISKILADTYGGLTGREIGSLLAQCRVNDTDPTATKWIRLFNALANYQIRFNTGNHVIGFIHKAMSPARYLKDENGKNQFEYRRNELNKVLALCGYSINDEGKVKYSQKVTTIDEALKVLFILVHLSDDYDFFINIR